MPNARLHVNDGSVVFASSFLAYPLPGAAPVNGPGSRMMWYANKAAFRAGLVGGGQWDEANVGLGSIALGHNVSARYQYSVAIGSNNASNGYASIALGGGNIADGNYSLAFGSNTSAMGLQSAAIGRNAVAEGAYALSIGNYTSANGVSSISLGNSATASTFSQITLGSYNVPVSGNASSWDASDPLLVLGNGTSSFARSTALTVLKNGNTGIGTGSPQARLQIEGNQLIRRNSFTGSAHLTLEETQSGDGSRLQFRNSTIGDKYWDVYGLTHASSPADAYFNIYYHTVGNTMSLRGNGNVTFKGTVSQNSDARLKKDIGPLDDVVGKLLRISGYRYHWKEKGLDSTWQAGLLAQEVEAVMPELVYTADDGTKSVNYSGLIPYLLEAIKLLLEQKQK
ncbi:MAG TPA: tail fiber domain-containing protein [Phnomibacter sp.]|nr:tail fiber domain-containing protein [Phnomibacter sp.]